MASVEKLQQAVHDGNFAQFWVEIAASKQNEIENFIATTEIGKDFKDRIRIFNELGAIPFGISPNSNGLQDLKHRYSSQGFNINVINFHDCTNQGIVNPEADIFNSYKRRMREMFANVYPQAIDAFISMFLTKIRVQIETVSNQLHQIVSLASKDIADVLLNLMTTISRHLLNPDDADAKFAMRFIRKGFIVGEVGKSAIILCGLPGRSEYLENIVFGSPVQIAFKNLGCDVFVQHRNGSLSEVVFNSDESVSLSLRETDVVKFSFSNDVGFRKIEEFEALTNIPCNIEIDFNCPKRAYSSSKSDESKRQQSRSQRILMIFDHLTKTVSDKIISIDVSNVSGAVNSEIFQLFGAFSNLKSLNLHNAKISNEDFQNVNHFPRLQTVDLSEIQINPDSFNPFNLFPSLKSLIARNSPEIMNLLSMNNVLPPISALDLSENSINIDNQGSFPQLDCLHTLTAQNTDFVSTNFEFLSKMPAMTSLNMRNCQFSAGSLHHLAKNAMNLVSLNVSTDKIDMNLSSEDFASVTSLKSLRTLKISNRMISDQFIENLGFNAHNLVELDVSFNMITNFAMSHFTRLKQLHVLKLTGCTNITDAGISIICESALKLREIDVRGTKVTEYGLASLVNRYPGIKINYYVN